MRSQPIAVTDPDLADSDVFLGDKASGGKSQSLPVTGSPREKLIRRGEMADALLGRIDNYRMPAPDAGR